MVVQKANVGSKYVYALQMLHSGTNAYVFRGLREKDVAFAKTSPVVRLFGQDSDTAGGHTQTWEYANQSNDWFIGTKPNDFKEMWTTQIARVHIPISSPVTSNTELPRLAYLNRAGYQQNINYAGKDMLRVEAAVTPDYQHLMIASIDVDWSTYDSSKRTASGKNGYFSIYRLSDINTALNNIGTGYVNIQDITCRAAFIIPDFVGKIGSVQGYDLGNFDESTGKGYIYVSSQYSGSTNRKIVKIPWGETNDNNWEEVNLTNITSLNQGNEFTTELEGIQLIGENDLYLTVAYHEINHPDKANLTSMNKIYRVSWNSSI